MMGFWSKNIMRILHGLLLVALSLLASTVVMAQDWPARPVTIVVPNPAGGPPDVLARLLANELSEKLGKQFIIENRGGGSGNIGSAAVAKAAPDGYTILLTTTGPAAINRLIYKDMQYNPGRDLIPIGLVAKSPLIIVAKLDAPFQDVGGLIAYAKANPGRSTSEFPATARSGTWRPSCCSSRHA